MTVGLIVGLLMVFFLGLGGWIFWLQQRFRKQSKGNVYCTFINEAKQQYHKLCKVEGQQVLVPKEDGVDRYLIRPDKVWRDFYPPGWPRFMQANIGVVIYAENNVEPIDPFKSPPVYNPELMGNIQDQVFSKLMLKHAEDIDKMEEIAAKAIRPIFVYALLGACVLAAIVSAVIAYMNLSSLEAWKAAWGM